MTVPAAPHSVSPISKGQRSLSILVVAEHASARFGGEAALPLHYFRVLRERGMAVRLVTHARTRQELTDLFGAAPEIHYIEDSGFHRLMWRLGTALPTRVAYLTVGFASRFSVQLAQRRLIRQIVAEHGVDVVHQPMPVSPREPSMLFDLGVPVVIGPMNGGLEYPPAFRRTQNRLERFLLRIGRANAAWLNRVMPGKRLAAALVVANDITLRALPEGTCANVIQLVENGVDLSVWRPPASPASVAINGAASDDGAATFVFMGRLVDWKAVDLLLHAFNRARLSAPMRLWVIGDGKERLSLESLATDMGIRGSGPEAVGAVFFAGWLSQSECASRIERADCLVLPSVLECGGAVVLEAMSMGKAVISTAWGGPLDYLDRSCGILVPPDSREALIGGLAAAMVSLAANPTLRQDMGRSGMAKVKREYDWDRKVDRMLEIYADAVSIGGELAPVRRAA